METVPKKTKTRTEKPCPKGTRKNKKTGLCEPYQQKSAAPTVAAPTVAAPTVAAPTVAAPTVAAPTVAAPTVAAPTVAPAVTATMKTKRERCPPGTRKNKKTGLCDPIIIKNKTIAIEPVTAAALTMPEPGVAPLTLAPLTMPEPTNAIQEETIKSLNQKKNEREILERQDIAQNVTEYDFLYPNLNDPQFNIKIAERKEFNDNKYDGEINTNIEEHANQLCNADFELAPHQLFVRNFLSFQTPYNSLLLYHGLGSGKTCSAISVAEEMRDYIMQMGMTSQIMIVASANVQSNFKVQLFDERKLKLIDGLWNIRTCTGNKFLKEINPMNMKGLSKENVIKQINRLIDTYYYFFGYVEFANYIAKKSALEDVSITDPQKRKALIKHNLRKIFNNRLIIIDEVHNIRVTEDNKDKRVAEELLKLIQNVSTLRLLLLSATPMFNSYKEIIWLVNLMNMNDRRATIEVKDVFGKEGSFIVSPTGEEIGRDVLERKATGYISFVRGENPYTFPYRIWPAEFAPTKTFPARTAPTMQLNGASPLVQSIKHLSLYLVDIGEYQQRGYNYIVERIKSGHIGNYNKQAPNLDNIETFGYTTLQQPLEGLNIIYPDERLELPNPDFNSLELVGGEGLKRIMKFKDDPTTHVRSNFDYQPSVLEKYGRIFAPATIGNYSAKIQTICDRILNSKGIILVYSQYIDAGLVPLALALEEMGFARTGSGSSLFSVNPVKKRPGFNYVMITGDKGFSPQPANDIKLATNDDNLNGEKVKVVLISQTGAEGLDLKFIRQVHILEPWYNMNRIEQIIGRAVRTCSHKALPFSQRNVEIYLYGSLMRNGGVEETADLYVYRLAEIKAELIGKVSRVLKEISVDCILNNGQNNFTEEIMAKNNVKPVTLELSSGQKLENYKIGDKPYSSVCDYMGSCDFTCRPNKDLSDNEVRMDTYNEDFIMMNNDKLIYKIKQLMKERFFYRKPELITLLNILKPYPLVQINAALHQLVEDKTEFVRDKYGRMGHLINIEDLYLFQPLEIKDNTISIYDRSTPLDVKHDRILIKMPKDLKINEAIIHLKEKEAPAEQGEDITPLITKIEEMYTMAISDQLIIKGEKNWYMFCKLAIDFMMEHGYKETALRYLVVEHIIDELGLDDILRLLNNLYANPEYAKVEPLTHAKTYIAQQFLKGKRNMKGFLWKDKNKQVVLILTGEKWQLAEAEDLKDMETAIAEHKKNILENLNHLIGFMNNFKTEDFVVFKTKNVTNPRDAGARCDQTSKKSAAIDILNTIVGIKTYSNKIDISQRGICILQELHFRLFDKERKNKKRWFLSPADSVLTQIEKFTTVEKKRGKGKKNI
jgi:hypothetical protein